MENRSDFNIVNNFFYKFYNYNVQDEEFINHINNAMYMYATRQYALYANDPDSFFMDQMQFGKHMFNMLSVNFLKEHVELLEYVGNK